MCMLPLQCPCPPFCPAPGNRCYCSFYSHYVLNLLILFPFCFCRSSWWNSSLSHVPRAHPCCQAVVWMRLDVSTACWAMTLCECIHYAPQTCKTGEWYLAGGKRYSLLFADSNPSARQPWTGSLAAAWCCLWAGQRCADGDCTVGVSDVWQARACLQKGHGDILVISSDPELLVRLLKNSWGSGASLKDVFRWGLPHWVSAADGRLKTLLM